MNFKGLTSRFDLKESVVVMQMSSLEERWREFSQCLTISRRVGGPRTPGTPQSMLDRPPAERREAGWRHPLTWWALLVVLGVGGACGVTRQETEFVVEQDAGGRPLFVHPEELEALRQGQGAVVLDARGGMSYLGGHITGAGSAPWQSFTGDGLLTGLLTQDMASVQDALQALGVRNEAPVVVVADWDAGWGEEGRLFWMLEYLGHEDVRILYGGMPRWKAEGRPTESFSSSPVRGDFIVRLREDRRATAQEVLSALESEGSVVVLDTRRAEEYGGSTPYGSARGGHIPTARHFYWKEVFGADGNLKPRESLRARLNGLGVGDDTIVIAYCTGGVRSGFMYAVMRWLEYDSPQNYDGSWWEWASRDELPVSDRASAAP